MGQLRPLLLAAALVAAAPAADAQPACPFTATLTAYLTDPAFSGGCVIGGRVHVFDFGVFTNNYDASAVRIQTAGILTAGNLDFAIFNVDATANPVSTSSDAPGFEELYVTFTAVPLVGTITGFEAAISQSNYQVGAAAGWTSTAGVEAIQQPNLNRANNTRFAFNGFQPFPTGGEACTVNGAFAFCSPRVMLANPVKTFDGSVRLGAYTSPLTPSAAPTAESMASVGYGGIVLFVSPTPVPEPHTVVLLAGGLAALAAAGWRRARRDG